MEAIGLVCLYGLTAIDDIRTRHIRVIEIVIFGIAGIVFNLAFRTHTLQSIFGGVMVGAGMYLFSVLSKEKMGKGDSLIIMVTGLYLGFQGTITLLWVSTILAAVMGTIFIKKHGLSKDIELPFIPFMLMGYLLIHTVNAFGGLVVCG